MAQTPSFDSEHPTPSRPGGSAAESEAAAAGPTIVIQQPPVSLWARKWFTRLLAVGLIACLAWNIVLQSQYAEYFAADEPPAERYHSGDREAAAKIALIPVKGTIMPPFTERILDAIDRAARDDAIKAVLLVVDSPGGLVADSHQIYHRLVELREKKPLYVAMQRMAASGGYYVAMAAGPDGRIYAEPTTWTGSIGVIIPRYDLSELAGEKLGVRVDPLKTGDLKDALNPFRPMTEREREVWTAIMQDAFGRFLGVITDNRPVLRQAEIKDPNTGQTQSILVSLHEGQDPTVNLATGQIFTADQALAAGLVDEIGFVDDAIDGLKERLGLQTARVVTYRYPRGLIDLILGVSAAAGDDDAAGASDTARLLRSLLKTAVPRAWYHYSSLPGIPSGF